MNEIVIDSSIFDCQRGIYGIFIEKGGERKCAYIGKSEQVGKRAGQHRDRIQSGTPPTDSLKEAAEDLEATIKIELLEDVPYQFDDYCRDAQRLASAENRWIDEYQKKSQCLEQVPEGKRPSKEWWEREKKNTV